MRRHHPVRCVALSVAAFAGLAGTPALGAQWRQPISLGTTNLFYGAPTVVTENDGGALIARAGREGTGVGYRVRLSGGAAFSPIRTLIPPCAECGRANYRIAMNGSGTAIVAWEEYNRTTQLASLKAAMIPATGVRGPIQTIASVPPPPNSDVTLTTPTFAAAVDRTGRAFVLSPDDAARPVMRMRTPAGGWSAPVTLAGPLASVYSFGAPPLQIAVNGTHVAVALPLADCTITVARLQPDGTWTTTAPQADPNCDRDPALSVTADGSLDLIWHSWRDTDYVVRTASAPPSGDFGPSTDLGVAATDIIPSIRRVATSTVAAWIVPTDHWYTIYRRVAVRTKLGNGAWGPVSLSPITTGIEGTAIGPDGTAVAVSTGTAWEAVAVVRKPFRSAWRSASLAAHHSGVVGKIGMYANGDLILATEGNVINRHFFGVFDFTGRSQPLLAVPRPKLLGLSSPKEVNAGAVARLTITANHYGRPIPLQIQQLRSGRWITLTRLSVLIRGYDRTGVGDVFVRPLGTGLVKLRAVGGTPTRVVGPVSLTVRSVLRKRIPVGINAETIQARGAGIWVAEGDWARPLSGTGTFSLSNVARRLSPTDGHTLQTVRTTGRLVDLAVGDNATWLVDSGSRLTRIDNATGATTSTRIPGWLRDVSANANAVWIAGVCPPDPTPPPGVPTGPDSCSGSRQAKQVDATSGQLTGVRADLAPTGPADRVVVTGATTWLTGEDPSDIDNKFVLGTINTTTGARTSTPAAWDGTPVWVLSDTIAWRYRQQILPTIGNPIQPGDGAWTTQIRTALRSGNFIWTLEEASPRVATTLVQRDLAGTPTGVTVNLGGRTDSITMTIRNNVAWVLQPGEATVIRVPLPVA